MDRPEYVKCIEHTHADKKRQSWCGRRVEMFDFTFQGIDHAAYAALEGARLVPCADCVAAVALAFAEQE